jgi:hypothetical protein
MSLVLTARRRERLDALAAELEKSFSVADARGRGGSRQRRGRRARRARGVRSADRGARQQRGLRRSGPLRQAAGRAPARHGDRELCRADAARAADPAAHAGARPRRDHLHGLGRGPAAAAAARRVRGDQGVRQLLAEALFVEQRRFGIDVLVVEPGSTDTEFHDVAGELPHPGESPAAVVETALEALGRQPSVVSGWFNWLRANAAQRIAPRSLLVHLANEYTRRNTPEDLQ